MRRLSNDMLLVKDAERVGLVPPEGGNCVEAVPFVEADGGRLVDARLQAKEGDALLAGVGGKMIEHQPAEAAVREAAEEIGVVVDLVELVGVLGGPDYEVTYPNGDRAAYVTAVYTARISSGSPVADGDEVSAAAWFELAEVGGLALSRFARALLTATGFIDRIPR